MGGAESSKFKIQLDRKEKFFFGGENVTGFVIVKLAEKDCNSTLYMAYASRARYYKPTKSKNPTLTTKWLYSAFHKIASRLDTKEALINADTYKFYFTIPVPTTVPPFIYSSKKISLISHYLQLSTNRKLKNPDEFASEEIIVYPRVSILNHPASVELSGTAESRQNCLSVTIDRGAFVPGDFIIIQYYIDNMKRNVLKSLLFQFVQAYTVEKVNEERIAFEILASSVNDSNEQRITSSVIVQIPTFAFPPTCSFTGGIGDEVHVNISYFVRARLSIKGFFNPDIVVSFPIMMGTEPRAAATIPNQSLVSVMKADDLILNDDSKFCYCDNITSWVSSDRETNSFMSEAPKMEKNFYEELQPLDEDQHYTYDSLKPKKILNAAEDALSSTRSKIASIISTNPIKNSFRNATRPSMNSIQTLKPDLIEENGKEDSASRRSSKVSVESTKRAQENFYELVDKVTIVTNPKPDSEEADNGAKPRVIKFTYKNSDAVEEIMRGIIDGERKDTDEDKEKSQKNDI